MPASSKRPEPDHLLTTPCAMLGGLSPQQFMKRHWQKKPLLVRQALPGVCPPVDRKTLFAMVADESVESRLIVHGHTQGKRSSAAAWTLQHGPLSRRSLPPLTQPQWTVLVQSLDLYAPAARALLDKFRFIPDARVDDLMVSFATDGGGVGPHYDAYDVFLIQVEGRRRWRIGQHYDPALVPGVPLKILAHFEPEQEWVLEPGDMLYLPPQWAHDGVAQGECMTCSVGFRVPDRTGLAAEMLLRLADELQEGRADQVLYRDPAQAATHQAALIPAALQAFAHAAVEHAMAQPHTLHTVLGEVLSEPKPHVYFGEGCSLKPGQGVKLDPRTRMLYDERSIYVNGESWQATAHQGRTLRRLADQRALSPRDVAKAGGDVYALLNQWAEDAWLHGYEDE